MALEFRCPECQRLLRTPDDSAGKQARCPQCSAIVPVPSSLPATGVAQGGYRPEAALNPYQSPADIYGPQAGVESTGEIRPTRIEVGDVIDRSWRIFQSQMGLVILVVFVAGVINQAAQFGVNIVTSMFGLMVNEPGLILAFNITAALLSMVFQLWITFGQMVFLLKVGRGENGEFTDLFAGGRYLIPGLLAYVVFGLVNGLLIALGAAPAAAVYFLLGDEDATALAGLAGAAIFLIPLVYVTIMFSQFVFVLVDRQAGPIESLQVSAQITRGNKLSLILLWIVFTMINLLGCLALCVGLIFTTPFTWLMMAVTYLTMTGQPTAERFLTPPAGSIPPAENYSPPPV